MNEGTFWLLVLMLAACTICFVVFCVTRMPNKDVEMAKAGYVEKVIVIGNPGDQYSRRIEKVWVKINDTPTVENK
jgi:hypothetical protein